MFRSTRNRVGRFLSRVEERGAGIEITEVDGVRALHIETSTVQSAMKIAAPFDLHLTYSRGIMSCLVFGLPLQRALIIGLGGGSIPKFIHYYLPDWHTTVVEIDPQIIAIARSHFHLPSDDDRLQVIEGDGAGYLPQHPHSADLLILDVFDGRGIPPELYSQAFFDHAAAALTEQGLLAVNLWGSDKNFDIYLQRIEQSFAGQVLVMPTGRPGNIVVFGFRRKPLDLRWSTLRERARELQERYPIEFLEFVERLRDNNLSTSNRLII